jgi:hypothetical protein
MVILEDLKTNSQVKGILPSGQVTVLTVQRHGFDMAGNTYRDVSRNLCSELLLYERKIIRKIFDEQFARERKIQAGMIRN